MAEDALKEYISKAEVSDQLDSSPCAIITSRYVKYIFFLKFKDGWISNGIFTLVPSSKKMNYPQILTIGWKVEDSEFAHLFEGGTKVSSEIEPLLTNLLFLSFCLLMICFACSD